MCLLLLAACFTTQVVNEWRNPNMPGFHLNNIVVAAMFKDDQTRRLIENEFAQQLSNLGSLVTRSYIIVPTLDENTAGQLPRMASALGADGFLIIRMLAAKPGPSNADANRLSNATMLPDFLQNSWPDNYQPPTTMTNKTMYFESRLFDGKTGKPVWTLCTEGQNQFGLKWEVNLLGKLVLRKMRKGQ